MQKTIIIQGAGIMQSTVCDLCGKESSIPQFEGWRRFINYRQGLRQDICRECLEACLTTRAVDLRDSAPSQALPTPEVYPLAEVAQLPPANH